MGQFLTLDQAGALLLGAGLAKLDNLKVGLGLIAAGAVLKVVVAVLQHFNIPVSKAV